MVGGDFNVIMDADEKIGGPPVYPNEVEVFSFCISSCELIDLNFKGNPLTWWNGRADEGCIFNRLDKVIVNQLFFDDVG